MCSLNEQKLAQIINEAMAKTAGQTRWQNAIRRAAEMIETNPFMHWTGSALLILSDSGELYEASQICQCKAFTAHHPCKHRAAYRLIALGADVGEPCVLKDTNQSFIRNWSKLWHGQGRVAD